MYSSRFDMEFVAVRIGNFKRDRLYPESPHHLSHADAIRVFERAVIQPGVKFEIVFGVSDSTFIVVCSEEALSLVNRNSATVTSLLFPRGEFLAGQFLPSPFY